MKNVVLTTRGLAKKYPGCFALKPTDISIGSGEIYGLVGKNGAGKTTLLRLITGQTMPTSGELELFGSVSREALDKARRRTGAMIETPSFYSYLSGAQNLEYYRIQRGVAGKECVGELLDLVGLSDAGKRKFKDYSLGMKQRLGLALALMNSPDLLILDEPVNGLDPMGIVEIRNLLLKLNRERNITIIISSHILTEMENLATYYGFIDDGVVLEQISAGELGSKCRTYIEIAVNDVERATALLESGLNCTGYEVLPQKRIRLYEHLDEPSRVSELLVNGGAGLTSIEVKGSNLEEYFVSLVGGKASV